jgi:hypothetical protein
MGFSLELPLTDFSAIACSPRFLNCLLHNLSKDPLSNQCKENVPETGFVPGTRKFVLTEKNLR